MLIRLGPILTLSLAFIAGFGPAADAQRRQPRCDGYPPGQGAPAMVVGVPGQPCYGSAVFNFSGRRALLGARVTKPAQHGRFVLVGAAEFEYTPNARHRGFDTVEVEARWDVMGSEIVEKILFRCTTEEHYRAIGGTASSPPPGEVVGRRYPTPRSGFPEH